MAHTQWGPPRLDPWKAVYLLWTGSSGQWVVHSDFTGFIPLVALVWSQTCALQVLVIEYAKKFPASAASPDYVKFQVGEGTLAADLTLYCHQASIVLQYSATLTDPTVSLKLTFLTEPRPCDILIKHLAMSLHSNCIWKGPRAQTEPKRVTN